MLGNRGREKRRARSCTHLHSHTRTKHRGTKRQERGHTPPRARPERARHGQRAAMARSFPPNRAGREEREELDRFALGRNALCTTTEGRRATEGAARDRHVDGSVLGSAVEKQGRERSCCHASPCTWCTWTERGRRQMNSVHHGSSLRFTDLHSHVHREPHPMDVSPIQNPVSNVAEPALATCPT
jgi:hypothetical protein